MRSLYILFILTLLMGCSYFESKEEKPVIEMSAEELYNQGLDSLQGKKYKGATEKFEEIERLHPYSDWAGRGLIMSAYAQYKYGKYNEAVATLERFVKLYPAHNNTAYAYYLRALCYYDQIIDVERDQKITNKAMQSLQEVVNRFPETDYGRDAALKIDLARDHLAGKEMEIGRYYLNSGKYIAAINRFKNVINNYQVTSHVEEALHRLVEAYLLLGVKEEALKNAAVLGHNYPNGKWYRYSYALLEGKMPAESEEKKNWYKKFNIF